MWAEGIEQELRNILKEALLSHQSLSSDHDGGHRVFTTGSNEELSDL